MRRRVGSSGAALVIALGTSACVTAPVPETPQGPNTDVSRAPDPTPASTPPSGGRTDSPRLTTSQPEPTPTPVLDEDRVESNEDMPLYSASTLGPHNRPISTQSEMAQAYFKQGVQLLFAFTPEDAVKAFQVAQKHDPSCAMCYFGEAWAWGPYLNGPMGEEDAPPAHAAITKAMELRENAWPVEKALIEAMATRYEAVHNQDRRRSLDETYAEAMRDVWEAFPNDDEVGTLYGEALMLLEPRRGNWPIDKPSVQHIHAVLEGVLARNIEHPGACHLYIHSTEPTSMPGKAEGCAEYLGDAIPGASHINHMPSHTYNRIGRWDDAVRGNTQAWHSDQKAEYGEGFAIYPSHNVHMLLFAGSNAGQGGISTQAARDYKKIVDGGQFYISLVLLRFGRFDEVLDVNDEPEQPVFKGLWEFARGYANLKLGDGAAAEASLARVRQIMVDSPEEQFRGHTSVQLLGVASGILEGEMASMDGRAEDAIRILERAVEIEDGLRYDEPEPLNFSARDWLGAVLIETERYSAAEGVYRAALDDHPLNGWSLFGLERALRGQGRNSEADRVRMDFDRSWERADVWIRSSRF
jgi:hypothetical protein